MRKKARRGWRGGKRRRGPRKKKATGPKCFNCSEPSNEDEFCHGCQNYICDECNTNPDTSGPGHNRLEHMAGEDDE